jgi:hypothetical protein
MLVLWKDVAHWLATHVCLVSRLRKAEVILQQPQHDLHKNNCACDDDVDVDNKNKKQRQRPIPTQNKTVAVACTFPRPPYEVAVLGDVTSLRTS